MEINYATREVNIKIVYYGPGLSGKTTNLEIIHQKTPQTNKGKLTALATEQDRTLFFDYMPVELGEICGLKVRLRLFTVPGQSYYNVTRKIVLRSTDGVVFVADSQRDKYQENIDSFENLKENLREHSVDISQIALAIQFNKRDLPNVMTVEEMNESLNKDLGVPTFPAIAVKGEGVFACLKNIASRVISHIEKGLRQKPTPQRTAPPRAGNFPKVPMSGNAPTPGNATMPGGQIPPQRKIQSKETPRKSGIALVAKKTAPFPSIVRKSSAPKEEARKKKTSRILVNRGERKPNDIIVNSSALRRESSPTQEPQKEIILSLQKPVVDEENKPSFVMSPLREKRPSPIMDAPAPLLQEAKKAQETNLKENADNRKPSRDLQNYKNILGRKP